MPPTTPARYAFLDHPGPIPFAHRGGAGEAPENTWTSFSHAVDLGYRYLETDAHATADGVVLAIHDPDLARTAGQAGLVRDMRSQDLAAVRLAGDEPIPRLDELLAAWPDVRWNIDAKHDSVVEPLAHTLQRLGAVDRVCVTSFSDRRLSRISREIGPRLCTAMGPASIASLRLASLLPGRAAPARIGRLRQFGAAQVPLRQGVLPIVDRRFIATAHRVGLHVHVWTVDNEVVMARLLDLGVDGIMTDRPTALKAVLEQRGAWSG
jgi:glycerophosphoryl diester phosphodiesterase